MSVVDPDQIDPGELLFSMEIDSLMALELMVLLEKNLGIYLTEAVVFEHPTIEDLAAHFLSVLLPNKNASALSPASQMVALSDLSDQKSKQQLQAVQGLNDREILHQLQGEV
jgi:acyl carrier protein